MFQKQNKTKQNKKTKTEEDRARVSTKIYRTRVFRVCCTAPLIHPAKHPVFPLYTYLFGNVKYKGHKETARVKISPAFYRDLGGFVLFSQLFEIIDAMAGGGPLRLEFESSSLFLIEVVVEELLPVGPTAVLPLRVVREILALERCRRVPRRTPSSPPTSRLPPPALGPITVICIQVRIMEVWRIQICVKN